MADGGGRRRYSRQSLARRGPGAEASAIAPAIAGLQQSGGRQKSVIAGVVAGLLQSGGSQRLVKRTRHLRARRGQQSADTHGVDEEAAKPEEAAVASHQEGARASAKERAPKSRIHCELHSRASRRRLDKKMAAVSTKIPTTTPTNSSFSAGHSCSSHWPRRAPA